MDRSGPVEQDAVNEPAAGNGLWGRRGAALVLALLAACWPGAGATAAQAPAAPQPAQGPARPAAPSEGIDRQPYRIELHLAFDPSARMDQARRRALVRQFQTLVHRFIGPAWAINVAERPSTLAGGDLESLENSAFAHFDPAFDKIWLVRVSAGGPEAGLHLAGREYDAATRKLGPFQEHRAVVPAEAPRALLEFALELFSPTALITGQEGGRALLSVRGAALAPASELGRIVKPGTVFVPVRLVTMRDNSVIIRRILFTYLLVESVDGAASRCAIVSALRDPLTQRIARPNTLAALGIKPGSGTLRFRFTTRPDNGPAAGYTLTARTFPEGFPHELGMTDRAGQIALLPGFADRLVILRLLAGNAEPMVEFPIMPGESSELREIPIEPKALTVTYQVQLDALRDDVIDLVAQRARLEKRLEKRLQGEDLDGLEQALKEYALLPRKDVYAQRLEALKDRAAKEQAQTKTAVLTKNIQARFTELQALLDRYLDDEAFTTYTDALAQKKTEHADAVKAQAKAKGNAARPAPAAAAAAPPVETAPGTAVPGRVGAPATKPQPNPAPEPF
jgi:hypothetical protein